MSGGGGGGGGGEGGGGEGEENQANWVKNNIMEVLCIFL